jgi:hypothetical protein
MLTDPIGDLRGLIGQVEQCVDTLERLVARAERGFAYDASDETDARLARLAAALRPLKTRVSSVASELNRRVVRDAVSTAADRRLVERRHLDERRHT